MGEDQPRIGEHFQQRGQIEHVLARSDDPLRAGDAVIVLGAQGGVLDVGAWDGREA